MNTDEKAIIDYLKSWPHSFVSGREVARKVGGKARYADDRGWAVPLLARLVTKGWLETDCMGYFRLKREEKKKKLKQYVSPQILRILKSSGKNFEVFNLDEDD